MSVDCPVEFCHRSGTRFTVFFIYNHHFLQLQHRFDCDQETRPRLIDPPKSNKHIIHIFTYHIHTLAFPPVALGHLLPFSLFGGLIRLARSLHHKKHYYQLEY